ncbi:hypothetical protein PHYBOEH_009445 [Phytophthora boehmeriae]|uniref:Uncharacterized protein n=1 Tax=Phytophthora boehmeriae TaxID=109152 RepID=A0A8T1VSJ7_9STRA|nr:hypothetical protein PHYBOEH_009445 [Phytophthora boehmeriae]
MTLSDLPQDVSSLHRKRPRSELGSRRIVESESSDQDVVIPPIQVDKDLLLQVVRVKVQSLIRNRRQQEKAGAGDRQDGCTADRLERLVPMIEQKWLQDLMSGEKPRYGFDEIVKIFREVVHSDASDGEIQREEQ